jgi:hypothetical protein
VLDRTPVEAEIDRVVRLTNVPPARVATAMARLRGEDMSDEDRARSGLNAPRTARAMRGHRTNVGASRP